MKKNWENIRKELGTTWMNREVELWRNLIMSPLKQLGQNYRRRDVNCSGERKRGIQVNKRT